MLYSQLAFRKHKMAANNIFRPRGVGAGSLKELGAANLIVYTCLLSSLTNLHN